MDTNAVVLARISQHKKSSSVPNKKTIAAMRASRQGKLVNVGHLDNLLNSLNKDNN